MSDKINKIVNTTDSTNNYSQDDINKNKIFAVLSYLWILFFLPLVACPDSKFGRFHANQGLVLLLAGAIGGFVMGIIVLVLSMIGLAIVGFILMSLFGLVDLILVILGIVNAATGKAKELPIIGRITLIK